MLSPCTQCRRHVRSSERTCPFCGSAITAPARSPSSLAGRFSRAAVFAGLASCYTTPPPQQIQQPPPPPPDERRGEEPPPDQRYAKPPAKDTGAIGGTVRNYNGQPMAHFPLSLAGSSGSQAARADANGVFRFDDLPPGRYQVAYNVSYHPRQGPGLVDVVVKAGEVSRVDIELPPPPPPDRGPCCKPYGAPPARRRVV